MKVVDTLTNAVNEICYSLTDAMNQIKNDNQSTTVTKSQKNSQNKSYTKTKSHNSGEYIGTNVQNCKYCNN